MRSLSLLALSGLLLAAVSSCAEEFPVYETHFEADGGGLVTWSLSPEGLIGDGASRVTVAPATAPETGNALKIETEPVPEATEITQVKNRFRLDPEVEYELRVKARVPQFISHAGGRFAVFVTDTRWQWQSGVLPVTAPDAEWKTYALRFKVLSPASDEGYRLRIRFNNVLVQVEISEISVFPIR